MSLEQPSVINVPAEPKEPVAEPTSPQQQVTTEPTGEHAASLTHNSVLVQPVECMNITENVSDVKTVVVTLQRRQHPLQ